MDNYNIDIEIKENDKNWELVCVFCGREFKYKTSYEKHEGKICRENAIKKYNKSKGNI